MLWELNLFPNAWHVSLQAKPPFLISLWKSLGRSMVCIQQTISCRHCGAACCPLIRAGVWCHVWHPWAGAGQGCSLPGVTGAHPTDLGALGAGALQEASAAEAGTELKIYFLWCGEGTFQSKFIKKKPDQSLNPVLHWPKPMQEVMS